jgi:hypothetical protein
MRAGISGPINIFWNEGLLQGERQIQHCIAFLKSDCIVRSERQIQHFVAFL